MIYKKPTDRARTSLARHSAQVTSGLCDCYACLLVQAYDACKTLRDIEAKLDRMRHHKENR